jgi:hypothetical protein
MDIYNVNINLFEALLERQKESHVVNQVGDILLQHVGNFEPFVVYGAHQMVAKHMFEVEKNRNSKFAEFVHVSYKWFTSIKDLINIFNECHPL